MRAACCAPGRASLRLDLGRSVRRSISISTWAAGKLIAQCRKQFRGAVFQDAVVPGAHQHFDAADPALLVKQLVEVRFPVHDADHARLSGQFARDPASILQALDPTLRLRVLSGAWLRAGLCCVCVLRFAARSRGFRRIEAAAQDPERQTLARRRQRQMEMQPAGLRARLIAADDLQAATSRTGCEVEVGSILDTQNRVLVPHPLHGARPMRRQNVLRRDRGFLRLVDHPVVAPSRPPDPLPGCR